MKLSMANTKTEEKPEEPKVPEKKETKEVETPKTTMTTETPRAPSEMSFEEQLAAAMKLSLEEVKEKKPAKLEDDVVIMNESEEGTDSIDTQTLYDSDAETTKPEVTEEPKPVVKVEEVDPVVLANTAQLMAICGVPEDREMDVRKWVEAKAKSGNTGINELLNLFLDEMAGRF